jgi:hypothetical protein
VNLAGRIVGFEDEVEKKKVGDKLLIWIYH